MHSLPAVQTSATATHCYAAALTAMPVDFSLLQTVGPGGSVGGTNDFGSSGNTGKMGSNTGGGVGGTNDFGSSGNSGHSGGSHTGGQVGGTNDFGSSGNSGTTTGSEGGGAGEVAGTNDMGTSAGTGKSGWLTCCRPTASQPSCQVNGEADMLLWLLTVPSLLEGDMGGLNSMVRLQYTPADFSCCTDGLGACDLVGYLAVCTLCPLSQLVRCKQQLRSCSARGCSHLLVNLVMCLSPKVHGGPQHHSIRFSILLDQAQTVDAVSSAQYVQRTLEIKYMSCSSVKGQS